MPGLNERTINLPMNADSAELLLVLKRAAEQFDEDGHRFLARAYEEAAYQATEHLSLTGAQLLLACDAVDQEHQILMRLKAEEGIPPNLSHLPDRLKRIMELMATELDRTGATRH